MDWWQPCHPIRTFTVLWNPCQSESSIIFLYRIMISDNININNGYPRISYWAKINTLFFFQMEVRCPTATPHTRNSPVSWVVGSFTNIYLNSHTQTARPATTLLVDHTFIWSVQESNLLTRNAFDLVAPLSRLGYLLLAKVWVEPHCHTLFLSLNNLLFHRVRVSSIIQYILIIRSVTPLINNCKALPCPHAISKNATCILTSYFELALISLLLEKFSLCREYTNHDKTLNKHLSKLT